MRTPKHGIRGQLESWSSKKYRSAKSVTPFIELAMAAYFVVAIGVAIDHGHYLSLPFLGLFLCGFGYVGWVSLWQGSVGAALRRSFAAAAAAPSSPPPAYPVIDSTRPPTSPSDITVAEAARASGAAPAPTPTPRRPSTVPAKPATGAPARPAARRALRAPS